MILPFRSLFHYIIYSYVNFILNTLRPSQLFSFFSKKFIQIFSLKRIMMSLKSLSQYVEINICIKIILYLSILYLKVLTNM